MSDEKPEKYNHPAVDNLLSRFADDLQARHKIRAWLASYVHVICRGPLGFSDLVTAPGHPIDEQRAEGRTVVAYLRRVPK